MKTYYVRVKTEEQLSAVLVWGRTDVLLLPGEWMKHPDRVSGPDVFWYLPETARESRISGIAELARQCPEDTGLVISSLDELGLLQQTGYRGRLIGDSMLYAYNQEAMRFYLDLFPEMQFLGSDELTDRELESLGHRDHLIFKIYGHQLLMVTAQCLSRNYTQCREKILKFRNEKGELFYALSSCGQCLSLIYQGQPVSMLDKQAEIPYERLLLDFTVETKRETAEILGLADTADSSAAQIRTGFSRGHHYQGID